eukprot:scaffold36555_cov51-Attheya_sp.AAC.4
MCSIFSPGKVVCPILTARDLTVRGAFAHIIYTLTVGAKRALVAPPEIRFVVDVLLALLTFRVFSGLFTTIPAAVCVYVVAMRTIHSSTDIVCAIIVVDL